MSAARTKKAPARKAGEAEQAALLDEVAIAESSAAARSAARALFDLSEKPEWRGDITKALRLALDLSAELAKLAVDANRRIDRAKWADKQQDLDLEEDDQD